MSDVTDPARPLVLTITPNPSLDLLFEADTLVWDDANRLSDPRRRPGGQGVNVARAARALGANAVAALLVGGRTGEDIVGTLEREGMDVRTTQAHAETRTFVAVRERTSGRSMLLNARGPERSANEVDAFAASIAETLRELRPHWAAFCGSLPAGFPADFYARLADVAHAVGTHVVIDCDGEAMRAGAARCDLLVPNEHEAARLVSNSSTDVVRTARVLLRQTGAHHVALTLGSRGAVLANRDECWRARPAALDTGSAVGAGDAFLAGLLVALDNGFEMRDVLRAAVAAGTGALLSVGSSLLEARDVANVTDGIVVERVDYTD